MTTLIIFHPQEQEQLSNRLGNAITKDAYPVKIHGYRWQSTALGFGMFPTDKETHEPIECMAVTVSAEQAWLYNQLKPAPFFSMKPIDIEGQPYILPLIHETITGYERPQGLLHAEQQLHTMPHSDLHLMVQCNVSSTKSTTTIPRQSNPSPVENNWIECLQSCAETDFTNVYVKKMQRSSLGRGFVSTKHNSTTRCIHPCFATMSRHPDTDLAVVDIVIPNAVGDARRIGEFFRADQMNWINPQGVDTSSEHCITLSQWLSSHGLTDIGERRMVAFAYGDDIPQQYRIDFLASECEPMGTIMGDYFRDMATSNIAQYDTAQVYASDVALLEISPTINPDFQRRLSSEAVEVFFIELIMLQDAAIARINNKVQQMSDQHIYNIEQSFADLSLLVNDMAKATRFFSPRNFRYPTVRHSAMMVAERFGLHKQLELMQESKALLEQLIQLHQMKQQNRENSIINIILVVLAVIQLIPFLISDSKNVLYATVAGMLSIIILLVLRYRLRRNSSYTVKGK